MRIREKEKKKACRSYIGLQSCAKRKKHTLVFEKEKEMATHSSVLAWRIPGMGEPGGLLSMGSHRVGHD